MSQTDKHSKKKICKVLGIERSSYYFCTKKRPEGRLKQENNLLNQEIIRIYHIQDGVYGAPKIRQELLKLDRPFKVSEKLVSLGIRQSISAKGWPYDNAPIESFHYPSPAPYFKA